ncbi:MAG: AAA family ATPase [Gammaproteobacteria bacterium]|nr:AAA family ATPase [Gammaproteobacteria bacterium]
MPHQMRHLFATILLFCEPSDAETLWKNHVQHLCEDFLRRGFSQDQSFALTWWKVEAILGQQGRSLEGFGLFKPQLDVSDLLSGESVDSVESIENIEQLYHQLNSDQSSAVDQIMEALRIEDLSRPHCFFVDGPAGSGKTHLYNTLYKILIANDRQVACVAWTGIAADLLPNGTTVHSCFKLPVPLNADSTSSIMPNSDEAKFIQNLDVIIWDEAPMSPKRALETLDIMLRDVMRSKVPFAGKVIVLGGDFRQVLPVVPHGSRMQLIQQCIKSSDLWHKHFQVLQLTENMRTMQDEKEFSKWLLQLGNGELAVDNLEQIELPDMFKSSGNLILDTFGQCLQSCDTATMKTRAILCPKNRDALFVNEQILSELPGPKLVFKSVDTILSDDPSEITGFPTEFLNSLIPSGMPPHELNLKEGAIVMLLRNLCATEGLCNGSRLIVKAARNNVICCSIASGRLKGKQVLIPRISIRNSDPFATIEFARRQFPLRLSFAMTINKAQGQTFDRIGILLPEPVFSHGQLYVAFSRARAAQSVKVLCPNWVPKDEHERLKTRNVVYKEVL